MYLTYANISHAHIWDYGEGILLYVEGLSYSCSCNSCDRKKTSTTIIPRCPLTYIDGSKSGLDVEVSHPNPRYTVTHNFQFEIQRYQQNRYILCQQNLQCWILQGLLLQGGVLWISVQVKSHFDLNPIPSHQPFIHLLFYSQNLVYPEFPYFGTTTTTVGCRERDTTSHHLVSRSQPPFPLSLFVSAFPQVLQPVSQEGCDTGGLLRRQGQVSN